MTDLDIDSRTDPGHTPWYLEGNFGPVFDEVTDVNLRVTGSIPPSLSGRYLRTGSNPPSGMSSHWFAGDGMVHGVRLDDEVPNVPRILRHRRARRTRRAPLARGVTFLPETAVRALF